MARAVRVRPLRADDAAAVLEMARGLAEAVSDSPPALDAETLLANALGPDRWCDGLVAQGESRLVGYVLACRGFEAHTAQRRLWIADLFVDPSARAAGVGQRLMQAVARRALAQGCSAVCWDLWRENKAGEAFYRRLGAKEGADLAVYHLTGEALRALAAGRAR